MLPLLYLIFVVSGAAGLMYESIWSRYLGLFVGHGAYAQILVLVIFLGGMSLGAHLVGRRSERLRDPLFWYAIVELVVAAIGVVFHAIFQWTTDVAYDALFPRLPAGGVVLGAKWLLAALLILPQSVLLGATFPLMSAGAIRRAPGQPGRTLSLLYFANSLGAAGGVLLAGFTLLSSVGLPGTLRTAALCNVAVALIAWLVTRLEPIDAPSDVPSSAVAEPPRRTGVAPAAGALGTTATQEQAAERGAPLPEPVPESAPRSTPAAPALTPALVRTLLLVAFGTAVASFVYEIAWIRMLSLVVGSATHSFELMLSAFILGLALGAWWIRGRADQLADPLATLGRVQWIMGSLAILTLPIYVLTFHAMAGLLGALELNESGYRIFTVVRYLFCLAVMLPATFCAGVTLPLITRILLGQGAGERAIGQVYAVNTLGSIVGASLAGLALMPLLGLKWLLVVGALIDVALGIWLLARHAALTGTERVETPVAPARSRARSAWLDRTARAGSGALLPTAVVGVGALLLIAVVTPFHTAVLSSGVYRYAKVSDPRGYDVPFYRDGRTATVSVRRALGSRMLTLATNGKPDASLSLSWIKPAANDTVRRPLTGDQVTQALLPLVTLAHHPGARSAAVIGQGSGMTSHLLLGSPQLRALSTIDIEPLMIEGSRAFYPANRRVFDDPRSTFVVDDAKAFFASARRTFDVIVSEPSNPWVSGVSGLFTDEFYGRVRGYLAPRGVFGQWLHLYEIDDRLVLSVLAALHRNFRSYEIYMVSTADIFVVASNDSVLPRADWGVVALPEVAKDLARTLPLDSATLDAMRVLDRAALAPVLDGWRNPNSDYFPLLDLGAERTRFLKESASGFRALHVGRFDPVAALRDWRVGFSEAPIAPVEMPRADARARGAAVRQAWQAYAPDGRPNTEDEAPFLRLPGGETAWVRDAIYRRAAFEAILASGRPPADWHRFVAHAYDVEGELHGGTAGVVDTAFYGRLFAYLDAARAPAEVRAAIAFFHGLAAYDFAQAADAADVLVSALARNDQWVRPHVLHDGAVVSAIRLGDAARATRLLAATAKGAERSRTDLRSELYASWIARVARAGDARRAPSSDSARPPVN
jgi:predicted membrane-bound spermidine synthase